MSRELAMLLAALLGGLLALSTRLIEEFLLKPRRASRVLTLIKADISAMMVMTGSMGLEALVEKFQSGEIQKFPLLVDPALPRETGHVLLHDNLENFSTTDVETLTQIFRHLKGCRFALLALSQLEAASDPSAQPLADAAIREWKAFKNKAQMLGIE